MLNIYVMKCEIRMAWIGGFLREKKSVCEEKYLEDILINLRKNKKF